MEAWTQFLSEALQTLRCPSSFHPSVCPRHLVGLWFSRLWVTRRLPKLPQSRFHATASKDGKRKSPSRLSIRQGPVFSLLWSEAASCGQVVGGWTGRQAVCPVSFGHFCHHLHVVSESDCLDRSWRCPASRRLSALLPAVTSHPPIRDWLWGLHEALRCRQKELSARYNI